MRKCVSSGCKRAVHVQTTMEVEHKRRENKALQSTDSPTVQRGGFILTTVEPTKKREAVRDIVQVQLVYCGRCFVGPTCNCSLSSTPQQWRNTFRKQNNTVFMFWFTKHKSTNRSGNLNRSESLILTQVHVLVLYCKNQPI